MTNLRDVLIGAGFSCSEINEPEDYERISEFRLPFGSICGNNDNLMGTQYYHDVLNGINFYRKNTTNFVLRDYPLSEIMIPDCVYDWLKQNQSFCKVLPNDGGVRCVSNGCLGKHTTEYDMEYDAKYGTVDIVFMIDYYTQFETFKPRFNITALNFDNPEQWALHHLADVMFGLDCYWDSINFNSPNYEMFWEWLVDHVIPKCEFVPIHIVPGDGCVISHGKYKTSFGTVVNRFTSPCLGKNIKKHQDIMDRLKPWMDNGATIVDDRFYIILENRETKDLYLRKWDGKEGGI